LDLIVIHTPKTVSLKNSVACWTARRQVAREEIAPIAEPPKQFTHLYPKRPPPENGPPQTLVSRPPVDADLAARSERDF
jgi:hypothetical protein